MGWSKLRMLKNPPQSPQRIRQAQNVPHEIKRVSRAVKEGRLSVCHKSNLPAILGKLKFCYLDFLIIVVVTDFCCKGPILLRLCWFL